MNRLRDVDSGERSLLIRVAVLAGVPVFILLYIVEHAYAPMSLPVFIVADMAVSVLVVLLLWMVVRSAGALTGSLFMPNGTPPLRQYSEPDALVARGQIAEAMDLYRALIVAYPEDLDARLRLGALLVSHGDDPGEAERCFLGIRATGPSEEQERIASNALIDIYRSGDRRQELKAELARFARLNQRNRAGALARRHLRQLTRDDASGRDLSE